MVTAAPGFIFTLDYSPAPPAPPCPPPTPVLNHLTAATHSGCCNDIKTWTYICCPLSQQKNYSCSSLIIYKGYIHLVVIFGFKYHVILSL